MILRYSCAMNIRGQINRTAANGTEGAGTRNVLIFTSAYKLERDWKV